MKQFIGAMFLGALLAIVMITTLMSIEYHDEKMTKGEMVSVLSSEIADEGFFITQVAREKDTLQVYTKTRYASGVKTWMRLHVRTVGLSTVYTEYKL